MADLSAARRDLAVQARHVFASDVERAPMGQRSLLADRCRRAVVVVATKGQCRRLTECDRDDLAAVARVLDQLRSRRMAWRTDDHGVTFHGGAAGRATRLLWADLDVTGHRMPAPLTCASVDRRETGGPHA